MKTSFQPLQLLKMMLSGWVNRHQQKIIDHLLEENRALKEVHELKSLRHSDDQHRRFPVKWKTLGRKLLFKFATIVNPDTILFTVEAFKLTRFAAGKIGWSDFIDGSFASYVLNGQFYSISYSLTPYSFSISQIAPDTGFTLFPSKMSKKAILSPKCISLTTV
jgi:hypothetical protein